MRKLFIFVLPLNFLAYSQTPAVGPPEAPFVLRVTSDLVLLDVSVKSGSGERISGLTKENFKVYEDGKLQALTHFSTEDVPVTAGLVMDTSGSMRAKRPEVITAAMVFIGASNPKDEIFVVQFSDSAKLSLPENIPFSSDVSQLRNALWKGTPDGRTALNDAIILALKHLEMGRRDRRALVLVSDGGDNSSLHNAGDVLQAVLESRATIYTIGVYDADDPDKNPGVLKRLASISGGETFLQAELASLKGICEEIASDIRTRYTIGYVPVRSGEEGASRKVRVAVSSASGGKFIAHTRTRYILPPNRAAAN
ncbi:MAG: VWA domain-containing protein [Bryobacteraceae bacterium]